MATRKKTAQQTQTTPTKKSETTTKKVSVTTAKAATARGNKKDEKTKSTSTRANTASTVKTKATSASHKAAEKSTKAASAKAGTTHTEKSKSTKTQPQAAAAGSSKPKPATTQPSDNRAEIVYQPEFEKSVLDQPGQHTGPVYRYSDAELQEFKEIILKKLEAARQELAYLQGLITRKDEMGTEDTENKYMSIEDGSGTLEREQLNQMASRQIKFIDHLEKALVRIENKTYGICRVTGKLIDKARLRAVPHATLSIEAKKALSKGS
ncbi:MAG: TraR/DksA C4-type zinc finger protein [Thermoflavifilum sp.]|nr:TraR/DksA C4-type zinc finger protein [Thermoflavifilum sp.]